MRIAFAFAVAFCVAGPAFAQSAPPPAAQSPAQPPAQAAPAPAPAQPATTGKSTLCRQQARQQKLRGDARRDFLQVCRLEGRLACLKEAIAKKITGAARRDYIKTCGR